MTYLIMLIYSTNFMPKPSSNNYLFRNPVISILKRLNIFIDLLIPDNYISLMQNSTLTILPFSNMCNNASKKEGGPFWFYSPFWNNLLFQIRFYFNLSYPMLIHFSYYGGLIKLQVLRHSSCAFVFFFCPFQY